MNAWLRVLGRAYGAICGRVKGIQQARWGRVRVSRRLGLGCLWWPGRGCIWLARAV